jgi:cytochrome P450
LEAALYAAIARKRQNSLDTGDALSILLDAQDEDGSTLTDTELLGHLTTLFTAGHETTASALTWTLFLLSQHPKVMADLMDELNGKLHGDAPTLEQLRDLPVLDHVINESLRMFPPGTWMLRTTTAPSELGPFEVPKGAHVVYSPAVTHRRPDIYPEPDRFLPERWETTNPSPYEFLPFGNGPRRCIGATYAMMELRVVLPMILQRFRPTVPPGARVDRAGNILSFPKGGLPVVLNPQDGHYTTANVRGNIHDLVDFY